MLIVTNLYVRLVDVRRVRELRLLAQNVRENDVLFEQKDLQLLRLLHRAGVALSVDALDTEDRAVQQQLALRRNLSLELLQPSHVHHVIGRFWNNLKLKEF